MSCFHVSQFEKKVSSSKHRKLTWWTTLSTNSNQGGCKSASERFAPSSLNTSHVSSGPNLLRAANSQERSLRVFSLCELKAATRNFNFDNYLGEGGFGCVYKGWVKLEDSEGDLRVEVAVKQLNARGHQGHKEWLSEVKYLGMAKHPNLAKLVGYCVEDDDKGLQMLLVYEFMPNKSLEAHLFGKGLPVLPWKSRLQIALGAAQGLAYLHEEMEVQIIYRDFKTSNILLDNDFKPKLSDFGLARQGPDIGASHVTTMVVGTVGYAAPEYVQTGRLTSKSDVWSFGVVLLELLTGRKALNKNLPKNEQCLLDWVKPNLNNKKKVRKILDPGLSGQYSLEAVLKLASLASHCLSKLAKSRPKMSDVVANLKHIIDLPDYQVSAEPSGALETERRPSNGSFLNPKKRYFLFKQELNVKLRANGHAFRGNISRPILVELARSQVKGCKI